MSAAVVTVVCLVLLLLVLWWLDRVIRGTHKVLPYSGPVSKPHFQHFDLPSGPSAGHRQVEAEIVGRNSENANLTLDQRVGEIRRVMDELPEGRSFDCDFIPVSGGEFGLGQVNGEWVIPHGISQDEVQSRRVLYIHGGAFFAGSPLSHRTITTRLARDCRASVFSVDYRLMPEHRRIDAINDCQAAYRWVLDHGPSGESELDYLVVGGDSAGGNLALVVLNWARDEQLRAADAAFAFSPIVDGNCCTPSMRENLEKDVMLGPALGYLLKKPRWFLGWMSMVMYRMRPSNPLSSPIYADLSGLPPLLIQASESEILLDDARSYVNKAVASGTDARLQTWPGLLHVWQIFLPEAEEADQAFQSLAEFLQSFQSR